MARPLHMPSPYRSSLPPRAKAGPAIVSLLLGLALCGCEPGRSRTDPAPTDAAATHVDTARAGGGLEAGAEASVGPDARPADAPAAVSDGAAQPPETPADRIVHWQINIGWRPEHMGQPMFFKQVESKKRLPDLVAVQDAWTVTMCGWGDDNRGLAHEQPVACSNESKPGKKSFVGMLRKYAGGRRYIIRYIGNGVKGVIWDSDRFGAAPLLTRSWNANTSKALRAACCGGGTCTADGLAKDLAIAVVLRDDRGTAETADDRYVGLASVHTGNFGGKCIGAILEHADVVFSKWEASHHEVSRRFISGDLNRAPDANTSHSAATRRKELKPQCWWRSIAKQASCAPNAIAYFDTVHLKHFDGSTANNAPICARWTFPMRSAFKRKCDSGSEYMRIDMVFVGNSNGTMARSRVAVSEVDRGWYDKDGDGAFDAWVENYSDHKGIYTEILY